VTRSQDHSQCSSHVVQGELLPKIDDDIDIVLGLAVFYQYVRTTALNQQQQTQHVSIFTTELFAHYLHIRCLTVMKCRPLTQTSSTDEVQRYQKCFYELHEIRISDVLVFTLVNQTKHQSNDQSPTVVSGQTMREMSQQSDTSELVELLQQSAVEHLTAFRQLVAQEFSSEFGIVTTDFEALYAYKCGEYQRCLQLSTNNVRTLIADERIPLPSVLLYPEFLHLMDDDIVSLIGLTLIVNPSPSCRFNASVHQLSLSLYLMTQCQMKLHHPPASLTQTLEHVKVARGGFIVGLFDAFYQALLKLTERKILLYICRQ